MFYVYILESIDKDFIYVGYTTDLKNRFALHNKKQVQSTKFYAPLKLVFYEAYLNQSDAKRREKYLKTTKGKSTLKTMLKDYYKG